MIYFLVGTEWGRLCDSDLEVLLSGAGVDEPSVVAKEHGGVGVTEVGCCGGGVFGSLVFV